MKLPFTVTGLPLCVVETIQSARLLLHTHFMTTSGVCLRDDASGNGLLPFCTHFQRYIAFCGTISACYINLNYGTEVRHPLI